MSDNRYPRVALRRPIVPAMTPGQAGQVRPTMLPTMQDVAPKSEVTVSDNHHFAMMVDLSITTPVSQSVKFLDQPNTRRNLLVLRNASAFGDVYIGFGKDASTNSTMKLTPGTMILLDTVVPQDDLYAFGDGAAVTLAFAYSTYNP